MCVGLPLAKLDDRTRAFIDAGACGVLLREQALSDAHSVAELSHRLKEYAGRPLFVAVDHEAMQRTQADSGFSRVPASRLLGERGEIEFARYVGQIIGRELRAVGVDVTLGPTMDVASSAHAKWESDRALGSDPVLVAQLSAALVEGQQSEGVASIGKHFPGHGETPPGEDDELPRMPHRFNRLEEVELRPFRAAMDARVAGIMVGHLVFEALDGRLPASLSRAIVFGLLRQKMSYRGVVMIDDVDSGGLERHHSRDVVALLGIASGADCFLCARRPESAWELISALENGLRNGSVVPERLEVARRRIDQVLHRYAQRPNAEADLSRLGRFASIDLDPRIDTSAHVSPGALTADHE